MHRYLLCIQTIPIVLFHLAEHFSSKHPLVPMYSDKWFSNVVCLLVCFIIQSTSCFSHQFQLGPQLFDNSENRGVRRGYFPAPRKKQFELGSTYSDIIKQVGCCSSLTLHSNQTNASGLQIHLDNHCLILDQTQTCAHTWGRQLHNLANFECTWCIHHLRRLDSIYSLASCKCCL